MKKLSSLLVVLTLAIASLAAGGRSEDFSLTVLTTNDTHGHPLAFSYSGNIGGTAYTSPAAGGIPARASYFDQVRAERPNVLVVDAGDFTTGLVVSNYFQGKPDVIGMKMAGYNALALGNHEFDNAQSVLQSRIADAGFPFLSANVYVKATGKRLVEPYTIVTLNNIKVGVIGVTTPETPITTLPANVDGLEFRDPATSINSVLAEVKRKADFVVVLSHLGIAGDRELAAKLSGVDLLIGGHSHTFMAKEEVVNNIPIFQAYEWGLFVGRIDVEVVDGKVASLTAKPVPINLSAPELAAGATATGTLVELNGKRYDFKAPYYPPRADIQTALEVFAKESEQDLATVIGTATAAFSDNVGGLSRYPRRDDSALSNMVTDAMRAITSERIGKPVDVFLQNGGGIRATLPAGPITKRAIYTVLPFDNTIQTASITGDKLLAILQTTALNAAVENYTTKFDGPNGAFLQVSGMTYTIDISAKTVSDVKIGGKALDPAATYLIGTQNFMMSGGDGYTILRDLPGKFETSIFQRDAVLAWVASKATLDPASFEDNRINIINTGR